MGEPKETWGPGRKTLEYSIALEGGPDLAVGPYRYRIVEVHVTTRWLIGQEEEGRTATVLKVREVRPGGGLREPVGTMFLHQLREVPDWLESIITRASPRDVG